MAKRKPEKEEESDNLRKELVRLGSVLTETDEALEEWIQECDRLQINLAQKDTTIRTLMKDLEETRHRLMDLEEKESKSPPTLTMNTTTTKELELAQKELEQTRNMLSKVKQEAEISGKKNLVHIQEMKESTEKKIQQIISSSEEELISLKIQLGQIQFQRSILEFNVKKRDEEDLFITNVGRKIMKFVSNL